VARRIEKGCFKVLMVASQPARQPSARRNQRCFCCSARTDGPIRKKSHGSEEFLRPYDYQLEHLPKGTIWRKDPVTFHGASHPMYAPRFLGVNFKPE